MWKGLLVVMKLQKSISYFALIATFSATADSFFLNEKVHPNLRQNSHKNMYSSLHAATHKNKQQYEGPVVLICTQPLWHRQKVTFYFSDSTAFLLQQLLLISFLFNQCCSLSLRVHAGMNGT